LIIRAECTIDLDEKRRVWSEVSVEADDAADQDDVFIRASLSAAEGAKKAYDHAKGRRALKPRAEEFKGGRVPAEGGASFGGN